MAPSTLRRNGETNGLQKSHGPNTGSNLSNKITPGFHLGAAIIREANHSFHDSFVPVKLRGDMRVLFGSLIFPGSMPGCL